MHLQPHRGFRTGGQPGAESRIRALVRIATTRTAAAARTTALELRSPREGACDRAFSCASVAADGDREGLGSRDLMRRSRLTGQRPASAAANSEAVAKRSAGTRAIAFWQMASSVGLTVVRVEPERTRRFGEHACEDRLGGRSGEWRLHRRASRRARSRARRCRFGRRPRSRCSPARGSCTAACRRRCRSASRSRRTSSARAIPKSATIACLFGEQDVLRLDVAVDDPVPMRVVQRVGDFASDPKGIVDAEAAARDRAGAGATRPRRTASRTTAGWSASPESRTRTGCAGAEGGRRAGFPHESDRGRASAARSGCRTFIATGRS